MSWAQLAYMVASTQFEYLVQHYLRIRLGCPSQGLQKWHPRQAQAQVLCVLTQEPEFEPWRQANETGGQQALEAGNTRYFPSNLGMAG